MTKLYLFSLMITGTLNASEWRLLDLDYFTMEHRRHINYRDAYFSKLETIEGECTRSKECFTQGVSALFGLTILQIPLSIQDTPISVFWRNNVHTDATQRQVRQVGWEWEVGVPIGNSIEVFKRHHSIHVMEDKNEDHRFPLRDEYVVKVQFYKRKGK